MESKTLNILFLCSWYPNPEDKSNGIFIMRHAQALALKHNVTVLFVKSVGNITEDIYTNVNLGSFNERKLFYPKIKLKIPVLGNAIKLLRFKKKWRELIDDVAKEKTFDIVHVNTIFPAAIPALFALEKFPGAQLFITEHWSGYYPEDGNYKGFYLKSMTQKVIARAKAIFVISENLKNSMLSHNLKGNYELINNVVDTELFKPFGGEKMNDGILRILHVSSLVEREKNISGIISVAEKLMNKNFKFILTIVGRNDSEIITHKNSVHQKKLNNHILFVGHKQPEELAEIMNSSNVFLLFSHFEGMPVVLLESMSCGVPVISTNVGQVAKIVKPGNGIVLNTATEEECIECLVTFDRDNFSDEQIMHQYVKDNYGMEEVCSSLTALYSKYTNA